MQQGNPGTIEAKAGLSITSGHLISSLKAQLTQLAIKTRSLVSEVYDQFHKKLGNATVGSCFIYNKKPSNRCSELNLDGCPDKTRATLVDLAWAMIVGQTN